MSDELQSPRSMPCRCNHYFATSALAAIIAFLVAAIVAAGVVILFLPRYTEVLASMFRTTLHEEMSRERMSCRSGVVRLDDQGPDEKFTKAFRGLKSIQGVDDYGQRSLTSYVKFDKPFPKGSSVRVVLAVTTLDLADSNHHLELKLAAPANEQGFTVLVNAWDYTIVNALGFNWYAYAE